MIEYSFYQLVSMFFIYGFMGWCVEVCFHSAKYGEFANRGFLNGPICPIYGAGVVLVVWLLQVLTYNWFLLFLGASFLCSALELVTGFILKKFFHQKWWDYSKNKFNFKGFICLKFSFIWGVACVFVTYLVYPPVMWLINNTPFVLGVIMLSILGMVFITDGTATVITMVGLNKRLDHITSAGKRIHNISDDLTEEIFEDTTKVKEGLLNSEIVSRSKRMLKAYPDFSNTLYSRASEDLKAEFKRLRNKKRRYHSN